MNIYFLVEGKRTEKKVYPRWISYLIPELSEISDPFEVTNNNFYLFTGNGYPSLLNNHLRNAVEDMNMIDKFDFLVICLDSDEETVSDRRNEVFKFIEDSKLKPSKFTFEVIVQNKCIETWFLGNRKIYSPQPKNSELIKCTKFYNVKTDNPELMTKLKQFGTCSQFHEIYLSEILLEKNIRYTKKNPNAVVERYYLNELIQRHTDTGHLGSFKYFIDFCANIRKQITTKE